MDDDGDDDGAREPRVIAVVGGPVDEVKASLSLYAEDLEPDAVTRELGCVPTRAFRKGEVTKPGGRARRRGAWILSVEGRAPILPDELLRRLLATVPEDPALWAQLRDRYRVQLSIAVFTGGWNRGFVLSPDARRAVDVIGVGLDFDLYMDGDDHEQ